MLNICVMTALYRLFFAVDLRLHGVDEMIFQPLNIRDIRDKYTKWTSAVLIAGILRHPTYSSKIEKHITLTDGFMHIY